MYLRNVAQNMAISLEVWCFIYFNNFSIHKHKPYETTLQTHHVDSTLKRRGNSGFQVVSTWNLRGVFVGKVLVI